MYCLTLQYLEDVVGGKESVFRCNGDGLGDLFVAGSLYLESDRGVKVILEEMQQIAFSLQTGMPMRNQYIDEWGRIYWAETNQRLCGRKAASVRVLNQRSKYRWECRDFATVSETELRRRRRCNKCKGRTFTSYAMMARAHGNVLSHKLTRPEPAFPHMALQCCCATYNR